MLSVISIEIMIGKNCSNPDMFSTMIIKLTWKTKNEPGITLNKYEHFNKDIFISRR